MYQKIRIAVVSLMAMMITVLSSVGTLSYFTDTDAATNEFTIGNAATELAIYGDTNKTTFDASDYSPLEDRTEIPFYLQATNNGNIPVYQRFRVVVPIDLADIVTLKLSEKDCTTMTGSTNVCSSEDYTVTYASSVEVNGTPKYAEYYIVSKAVIPVGGKTSEWPATGIYIEGISEANGSLFTCANSNKNNCVMGIDVYSDVIQTTGFANAAKAFEDFAEKYE